MVVRDEVLEAVGEIVEVAGRWRRSYDDWQRALKDRDRVAERMERRVTKATGGLSAARFEVACRRRSFHDIDDAQRKARAIRARPAVEAAVAERDRVIADADARVLAARIDLAHATKGPRPLRKNRGRHGRPERH